MSSIWTHGAFFSYSNKLWLEYLVYKNILIKCDADICFNDIIKNTVHSACGKKLYTYTAFQMISLL